MLVNELSGAFGYSYQIPSYTVECIQVDGVAPSSTMVEKPMFKCGGSRTVYFVQNGGPSIFSTGSCRGVNCIVAFLRRAIKTNSFMLFVICENEIYIRKSEYPVLGLGRDKSACFFMCYL